MLHAIRQLTQLTERRVAGIQIVSRGLRNGVNLTPHRVERIIRADDDTLHLLGARAGMAGMFGRLVAFVDQALDLAAQGPDDVTDPISGRTGLFSEALYLTGDDSKATPGLPRPRRLDAGIQRQQPGLFRNPLDGGGHATDLAQQGAERAQALLYVTHRTCQVGNVLDGPADQGAGLGDLRAGRGRGLLR